MVCRRQRLLGSQSSQKGLPKQSCELYVAIANNLLWAAMQTECLTQEDGDQSLRCDSGLQGDEVRLFRRSLHTVPYVVVPSPAAR